MKKSLAILIVLCISVSLFAIGSVKVGGAFNFVTGGTKDFVSEGKTIEKSAATYKSSGFGFDVSGSFDIDSQLAVWADFDMVFCSDLKIEFNGETHSFKEDYETYEELVKEARKQGFVASASKMINILHIGAGVAYKLSLQAVDVKVGGGLFFERGYGKIGFKYSDETYSGEGYEEIKASNFGLSLYADASYKFTENIGAGITIMPSIGLFNTTTFTYFNKMTPGESDTTSSKASGIKISFSMPVVIEVSYSF